MPRTKRPIPEPSALNPLPPNTKSIIRTGQEAVAYHIPTSPPSTTSPLSKTTISLPRYSTWSSGLHFHTAHTEYLQLVKGSIFLKLDGSTAILSADAGGEVSCTTGSVLKQGLVVEVPRFARHNWGRADKWFGVRRAVGGRGYVRPVDVEDEVVVEEWTEPGDVSKPLFFWNLNGVITAPYEVSLSTSQRVLRLFLGAWWVPFQLFVIFWDLDNWPVLVNVRFAGPYLGDTIGNYVEASLEYLITFVVLFTVKIIGWVCGVRAVEQKRVPGQLWEAYSRGGALTSR